MNETSEAQSGSVLYGLYLDILTGIMSSEYPTKSTLPTEDRLARDYGVSRSVVRSALEMLKKQGIVRSQRGSGTVVACCDLQNVTLPDFGKHLPDLQDCYACRLAIEPEIAAQLAIRQSDAATAYLGAQLQDLDREPGGDMDADSLGTASDAEFHVRLAEYSENSFFSSIMVSMRPHMLFSMNIKKYLTKPAQQEHINLTRLEHREIIGAILNRDASAAHRSMRDHIANGRDRIFLKGLGQIRSGMAQVR